MSTLPETECATGLITYKGKKVYSFGWVLGIEGGGNGWVIGLYGFTQAHRA